ncbi:carboxylic acid transporter [Clavulina sp. PMI_390]|nr:carboxylic acid transporter [Clavulina sp. PMI_390]
MRYPDGFEGTFSEVAAHHFAGLFTLPKKEEVEDGAPKKSLLQHLLELNAMQWITFWCGWLAWTTDALDFFAVSLSVTRLTEQFDRPTTTITQSITLTLLFRSLGALIFGLASDRYGRRWPLVFVLVIIVALQIGTSFTQTFHQFLACRSLFGIAMGGVWGMASATSLEMLPVEVRGLASGVLQQGYAVGYLIGAVMNLWLVPKNPHTWRSLFWVAAGISGFAAIFRAVLPESPLFLRAKADREQAERDAIARGEPIPSGSEKTRIFFRQIWLMLKTHWLLCIYAVLLMTGFNFLSHGSQDIYPTYLQSDKLLSSQLATKATIIGNCGAVAGGTIAGLVSQHLGRRLTMLLFILLIGCFIPLWIIPGTFSPLAAGAFCVQFGVQGAWGVIPIHLAEMSPTAFRATFPGLMYQMGNMVSSASSQIESTGAAHLKTTVHGKVVGNYAKVQGILLGTVAIFTFIIIAIGPEKHGSHFERSKMAFEEGAGLDEIAAGRENVYAGGRVVEHGDVEASGSRQSPPRKESFDEEKTPEKGEEIERV